MLSSNSSDCHAILFNTLAGFLQYGLSIFGLFVCIYCFILKKWAIKMYTLIQISVLKINKHLKKAYLFIYLFIYLFKQLYYFKFVFKFKVKTKTTTKNNYSTWASRYGT